MGQKVNPHGLRVGVIKDWDSKWYAEKDFADYLVEDNKIRTFLKKKLYSAGVSKIEIERASDRVKIVIFTAKPGVVIGKGGAEIEKVNYAMSAVYVPAGDNEIVFVYKTDREVDRILTEKFNPDFMQTPKLIYDRRPEELIRQCFARNKVCYLDNQTGTNFNTLLTKYRFI